MVFGRTTFENHVSTDIPQDVEPNALISLMHDHSFLITMQPIVTRHEIRERDPTTGRITYDVWENINLLPFGLWKHEISFTSAFTDLRGGVQSCVEAGMRFVSDAEISVKPGERWDGEGGGWVLHENIKSSCNVVLKWFVEGQMVPVRQKMHAQMIDAAREREKNVRLSRESGISAGRPEGDF